MTYHEKVQQAAKFIQEKTGVVQEGTAGVILGTGLGGFAASLADCRTLEYADIPHFPTSTVQGHGGNLRQGTLAGRPVLAFSGRFHLYEGYEPTEVCFGVRVLGELGVKTLIVTNAAGALNPLYDTGSLMVISDHINLTGRSPLRGDNHDPWGPRFPDMSRVWCPELRSLALEAAARIGIRLERGVYAQVLGPNLETPAETRMLRILGADAVGMSTVQEAIAARHMGIRLLGVSCLTNKNLPDCMAEASIEEIIAQANASAESLTRLLAALVPALP